MNEVSLRPGFLSDQECDDLISFLHIRNQEGQMIKYDGTYVYDMKKVSPFNFKIQKIRKRCKKYLLKQFKEYHLKLDYDQLVLWPPGSFKHLHTDPVNQGSNNKYVWASVFYLNDNFEGGETIIETEAIVPQRGGMAMFNSSLLAHGVAPANNWRVVYIAWWLGKNLSLKALGNKKG